jgi:hypothetical protein
VSEAGIVVAKPRIRWRVPSPFLTERNRSAKVDPGSTCRWKTLCVADAAPFDEGAVEPALAPRAGLQHPGVHSWISRNEARQRASEVGLQAGTRLTTPWPGSPAHAVLCSSPRRRAVVDTTEVGGAPSIARPPEVGPRRASARYGSAPRQSPDLGREVARSARLTPCAQDPNGPRVLVMEVGCRGR